MINITKTTFNASLDESLLYDALSQYGIPHPSSTVIHKRFSRWGRKLRYWAIACYDGYCFGDFMDGIKESVFPPKKYTKEERQQRDAEIQRIFAEADAVRKEKHQEAKGVANQIWDTSVPVIGDKHAYLIRKKVQSFGLRTISVLQLKETGAYIRGDNYEKFLKGEDSLLVIPLQDTEETIHSIQFINSKDGSDEQGNKMLLGGGKKNGHYFPIGEPLKADGYILLCEGYSTGATLYEATGHHVICCIDAGNLLPVAQAIRAQYPEAKMIMCADDDGHKHKDDPSKINVGLEKAKEAGNAVGAYVFHPVFSEASIEDPSLKPPSDFNDLFCREGIDAVKKQVDECLQVITDGGNRANVFQPAVAKPSKITPPQDFSEGNIIEIIAYVFDMQSGNYSLRVKFFDCENRPKELDLNANEVEDRRLLQAKLRRKGFDFSLVFNCKSLHEYLKTANPTKKIKQTDQTRWIKKNVYVSPAFIVSRDECEYEFAGGVYHGYGIRGTLEEWKTEVAKYAVGNHNLTDGLCVGLSGMLMKSFEDIVSSTVIHHYGKGSIGKTTTLNMVASLYGHPKHFKKSWLTTKNGIEGLLSTRNDACLILDELGKVGSKAFGSMPYLIEGGEGKTRMTSDASMKEPLHWRTMVFSTGEITMAEKIREGSDRPVMAGESVRFVDILAESKHGIFDELHGFKSGKELSKHLKAAAAKYYGTASKAFVEYMIGLEEEDIRKLYDDALKALEEKFGLHKADGQVLRVADVFALKETAGVLAVEAGILPHTKEQIQESIHVSFKKWLDERGDINSHEERQVLNHVTDFLRMSSAKFRKDHNNNHFGECWGYVSVRMEYGELIDRTYYIYPEAFEKKVLKGFPYKSSYDVLKEVGMLLLEKDGKNIRCPFERGKRLIAIKVEH